MGVLVLKNAAAVALTVLLTACGGGSGGSAATNPDAGQSSTTATARQFAGSYQSDCFALGNAHNLESGNSLYAKYIISVGTVQATTAALQLRLDFYDDANCAAEPVGMLVNNNAANLWTLTGSTSSAGKVASKVRMDFGMPSVAYQAGPTSDTVTYGTALRLQLPRVFFGAFYVQDLWYLDGSLLYEGGIALGSDGYPTTLNTRSMSNKITAQPPAVAAACASDSNIHWLVNGQMCSGSITASASGRTSRVINNAPSNIGAAEFSCSNGAWSASPAASCSFASSVVQTPCPAQSWTWSSGAYTCSGSAPQTYGISNVGVANTVSGNMGLQMMVCSTDGTWSVLFPGNCSAQPAPVVTQDPLQLAQQKNCLSCHAVTGRGSLISGLSFPSFEEVASYYQANSSQVSSIRSYIKNGSVGIFGTTPMPANPQVSDADLDILIPWILAQPH